MKTLQVTQVIDGSVYDRDTEKHNPVYVYEVDKVTNSVIPAIRTRLTRDEMVDYCCDEEWNVTIK